MVKHLKITWLAFALGLVGLFLVTWLVQDSQAALTQPKTMTPNMMQARDLEEIQRLQTSYVQHPEDKGTIAVILTQEVALATQEGKELEQEATDLASGKPRILKTVPTLPIPTIGYSTPFPTAIKEIPSGIFPAWKDKLVNVWEGHVMDQNVWVYAGVDPVDPSQGVLDIEIVSKVWGRSAVFRLLAPTKTGSLRIQSVVGYRLIITTDGGDTLYFDVASQSFVASLDAVSPATKTPLPNDTPTLIPTWTPNPDPAPIIPNPNPYPYP